MDILRYTAFSLEPGGGNPAGVVLDAAGLDDEAMQKTAKEVGYSETAFLTRQSDDAFGIRYFSPQCEVPFCGHATIAAAVAFAEREGTGELRLITRAGPVPVNTARMADETITATLTSVPPRIAPIEDVDLRLLLDRLGWAAADLDPAIPPSAAYAGAWHPIIAAATRPRLADLHYDLQALLPLMERLEWATINLVWRESDTVFHARNPFPPGGVIEDPATGAAAAALGGYLRELGLVETPAEVTVLQGFDMGRPSRIIVGIPAGAGSGIAVTGTASRISP